MAPQPAQKGIAVYAVPGSHLLPGAGWGVGKGVLHCQGFFLGILLILKIRHGLIFSKGGGQGKSVKYQVSGSM